MLLENCFFVYAMSCLYYFKNASVIFLNVLVIIHISLMHGHIAYVFHKIIIHVFLIFL